MKSSSSHSEYGSSIPALSDSCPNYSPYGQWKPVEETPSQMPDLQLPVDDSATEHTDEYQLLPLEVPDNNIHFEEKVVQKKISSGKDTFKKRQIKPDTKRNVRRRDTSP